MIIGNYRDSVIGLSNLEFVMKREKENIFCEISLSVIYYIYLVKLEWEKIRLN